MATATTSPAKKGTAQTEAIIGSAAAKLSAGVASLQQAASVIGELAANSQNLSIEVAAKEDKIRELDVEFGEKKRSKEVELKLQVQADVAAVVQKYATDNGYELLASTELARRQETYDKLNDNYQTDLQKGIGAATSAMKTAHAGEIALKEAEFRAKEAQNTATIQSVSQQLQAARDENERLYKQIEAEREASVKRAQASAVGAVNIGTPNGGR